MLPPALHNLSRHHRTRRPLICVPQQTGRGNSETRIIRYPIATWIRGAW